jgi:hypothetical protein
MVRWPTAGNVYPVTPKAYPSSPNAYPATVNAFPSGVATTPLTILGSAAWWVRADLGITIGTGVSAWADQSGNGADFSQGTGSAQPTFSASAVNGQPSVIGDGVNDRLSATLARAAPGTQSFYLWFLLRQVAWSVNRQVYNDGAGVLHQSATTPRLRSNNAVNSTENAAATVGDFKFIEVYFSNSVADYVRIGATAVTGVNTGNSAGTGTVNLFGNNAGTVCSAVEICEAGCHLGTPTGAGGIAGGGQRSQLAQYMSDRYGAAVLL